MTELLTAAQMRAIEQAAIDSGEVTGLELMERAGRGVVEAIFEEWPDLKRTSHRAVVLCGPGNNGGDGFVVARLLHHEGWNVEVFLYGDPEKLPPDARVNWERWREVGLVEQLSFPHIDTDEAWSWSHGRKARPPEIIVDALFGTGLTRPLGSGIHTLVQLIEIELLLDLDPRPKVVAVDIPSGHCADSGKRLDDHPKGASDYNAVGADLSVTFHAMKSGHLLEECPDRCGKLVVASIGLKGSPRPPGGGGAPARGGGRGLPGVPPGGAIWLTEPDFAILAKDADDHKYTHGHALILSGPSGRTGAARLAARGALRIGAGLVTVAAPPDAMAENAAHLTAIMLRPVADAAALAQMLEDPHLNALCLGPGLGLTDQTRALVAAALAADRERSRIKSGTAEETATAAPAPAPGPLRRRAVVLDADALTAFQDEPDALFSQLHENCVLTPHAGEFARLFPDIAEKLAKPASKGPAYSKLDATREAAKRAGCTVLFKGPDTVIADPTGAARINSAHYDRAAPWLATAGSGDVLAGFITGLLARGLKPLDAASTTAWLHVECALGFGPGLIAEDIPEELPKVFRTLGL